MTHEQRPISFDNPPSLEMMCSRIYDPVLYPSQANLIGDLRADAIRLLDLIEDLTTEIDRYRRSLVEHHDIANLSDAVLREYDYRACPVCARAHHTSVGSSGNN